MVRIENLSKRYKNRWAIKDINLEFNTGEIIAIMGPNGSGKTTLIKSLIGLVVPTYGKVWINGIDITKSSEYKREIGYMAQIPSFPDNLTPKFLINLIRDIYGKDNIKKFEYYIEKFSLGDFMDIPIKALSGGTRQKLNALLCLSINAKLYLLDEPITYLDPITSLILKEELVKKRNNGATVIISTHIIPTVEEIADKIVYLLEGNVKFFGYIHDLKKKTSQNSLEKAIASLNYA